MNCIYLITKTNIVDKRNHPDFKVAKYKTSIFEHDLKYYVTPYMSCSCPEEMFEYPSFRSVEEAIMYGLST